MNKFFLTLLINILILSVFVTRLKAQATYQEPYRPQVHFSPLAHWMNDPNGMVYYKGVYHLFYQYFPGASHWGPMHWGHAISKDLVHWDQKPIALYPDSLGFIFSGSAVADIHNTSGFGKNGQVPLVAIFTSHNAKGEQAGRNDFQNQSIAYSLDEGKTWTKYANNPVVKNPGIRDFRDPKVTWYEAGKKWIMVLATQDHVTFYASKNLKEWVKESEFGKELGSHGGVWECPDLFQLEYNGKPIWVLTVSMNPGAPNGGSGTQYFTGTFNGHQFVTDQKSTKWMDYGMDNYAGVTWSNTGKRVISLGWMSNWLYAGVVPTENWRGATTVPRDISILKLKNDYYLTAKPVRELEILNDKKLALENVKADQLDLNQKIGGFSSLGRLSFSAKTLTSFSIILSNDAGENVVIGYDQDQHQYYTDRTHYGKTDFEKSFGGKAIAPRIAEKDGLDITLIFDKASVELFAEKGLTAMTEIFFPNQPFNHIQLKTPAGYIIDKLEWNNLNSIWKK